MVYTGAMKQLNGMFALIILVLGVLSVAYIWKTQDEKTALQGKIDQQTQEIEELSMQLTQNLDEIEEAEVKGVISSIGVVTGKIQYSDPTQVESTIVCAQDNFTQEEYCTDELVETNDPNLFQYTLEIPNGRYKVYATTLPDSQKVYFSKVQTCDDPEDCAMQNLDQEGNEVILEVLQDEVQKDINIYL